MEDTFIIVDRVDFTYPSHSEEIPPTVALKAASMKVQKGQFITVIGRNGSGKSTFARLLNGLLQPTQGMVLVNNIDTRQEEYIWEIRRTTGMVFQNPDNQIIGTTVEEDVAFGPENLGVPPQEIRQRVDDAIATVGMSEYAKHGPHLLSGGQKQRVAIAGILAMKPECIILDEATAMLDPVGRKEVMRVLQKLNRDENITILHITHHMEEAIQADRVIVVDRGEIVLDGTPREVFANVEKVKSLGLDVPQVTELMYGLRKEGLDMPADILDVEQASLFLESIIG